MKRLKLTPLKNKKALIKEEEAKKESTPEEPIIKEEVKDEILQEEVKDEILQEEKIQIIDEFAIGGFYRSGSTFIWQVLNELTIDKTKGILRTHGYVNPENFKLTIIPYRDIRDILYSKTFRENHLQNIDGLKMEILSDETEALVMDFIKSIITRNNDTLFIQYEKYFPDNTKSLIKLLGEKIGEPLTTEKICELDNKFSIENNKKIMASLDNFYEWDATTMIHGKHIITNGKGGWWRNVVPETFFTDIREELKYWIRLTLFDYSSLNDVI